MKASEEKNKICSGNKLINQVAIIGIDGSGKSSCFDTVSRNLKLGDIAAIGDDVFVLKNSKAIKPKLFLVKLKIFLGRRVKQIRSRKLYRLLKFIELLIRVKLLYAIHKKYNPKLILTDGSPLINILGWGHYYCPDIFSSEIVSETADYMCGKRIPNNRKEFFRKHTPEIYLTNLLKIRFHVPELVFFLKVSPDEAISRIKRRHEEKQLHETKTFLTNLQNSYTIVCDALSTVKIIHIETDGKTIETVANEVQALLIKKGE